MTLKVIETPDPERKFSPDGVRKQIFVVNNGGASNPKKMRKVMRQAHALQRVGYKWLKPMPEEWYLNERS